MPAARPLSFADLLRHLRRAAGLTQEELAERAGLSRTGISELERGLKRVPHRYTISRLADALALSGPKRALFEAVARGRVAGVHAAHNLVTTRPSIASITFVGRERELSHLHRFLVEDGPPLLMLSGQPGIGKSRLLREIAEDAQSAGWAILKGGCQRRGGLLPFTPLLEALSQHLAGRTPAQIRDDLDDASWLVRLLPELADLAVVPTPTWTVPPEHERRLMFAAVGRYLANVAGRAGTLLLLDDLQWAGVDALDLLSALVDGSHATSGPRVRILGAYRSTEVAADHALSHLVTDLARDGLAHQLPLGPLQPDEARQLLEGMLGDRGDAERAALIDRLLARAGGVPFYLVSCARGAQTTVESGDASGMRDDPVPWDAAQSIRQRVAGLPQRAQDALGIAAVMGRTVPGKLLAAVTEWAESELATALEAICRAQLLMEWGNEEYQFAHDLIREVVEGDLSAARRRLLHERIAGVFLMWEEPCPPVVLAHHFERAGNRAQAVRWLERAAEVARHAGAFFEARDHLRSAIALAPDEKRAQLHEQVGDLLLWDSGFHDYRAAYDSWRRCTADDAALGARLVRKMLFACLRSSVVSPRPSVEELVDLQIQAVELAESIGDSAERWRLRVAARFPPLWMARDVVMSADEVDEKRSLVLAAAAYFEEHGDGESLSAVLDVYSALLAQLGSWTELLQVSKRRLAAPNVPAIERGDAMGMITKSYLFLGHYGHAIETARAAFEAIDPSTSPELLVTIASDASWAAWLSGQWQALDAVTAAMRGVQRNRGLTQMYLIALLVAMAREDSTAADEAVTSLKSTSHPDAGRALAASGLHVLREACRRDEPELITRALTHQHLLALSTRYRTFALMFAAEHGARDLDHLIAALRIDPSPTEMLIRCLSVAQALASGDNAGLATAIAAAEAYGLIPHAARMRIVFAERTGDRSQVDRARPVLERLGDRQFLRRLERVVETLP